MKKMIFFLCTLTVLHNAFAYDFSKYINGKTLYFTINSGTTTVTLTSPSSSYNPTGDLVIPSTVSYGGTTYTVTSIGNSTFKDCVGLTSVTIPSSIVSIGYRAFFGCSGLSSITIPDGVFVLGDWAFCNCTGLTSVSLGDSITVIGDYAFAGCSGLTSITIPQNVDTINDFSFYQCTGITTVYYNAINCRFIGRVNNYSAFYYCGSNLTSVIIGNNVLSIPSHAFSKCGGLTSVSIPNTVTSIGASAFAYCNNLVSINIPNNITHIREYTFYECSGLLSITIPENVTYIGSDAFKNCVGLTTIYFNATNCQYMGGENNNWVFSGCTSITNAIIGNLVNIIPNHAFQGCTGLTSVSIGSHVDSIGSYSFYGCSELSSITINDSVSSIGNYAFYNCTSLDTVFLLPENAPSLGTSVFGNNASNRVFIFSDCSFNQYYNNSSWYNYRNALHYAAENMLISLNCSDATQGTAQIVQLYGRNVRCDSSTVIQAIPAYGYHFDYWSNGNISNPDTLFLTGDSSVTAFFAKNQYSVVGVSSNNERGVVSGSDTVDYLDPITLIAIANYGYHFTQWSDGNTDNPRTLIVTRDSVLTAQFGYNQYSIALSVDNTIHGTVNGAGNYNYLSSRIIRATASHGYHFTQWNDGVTDNPRTITLTQDTSFTAFFGINTYTISVQSSDTIRGSVTGGTTTEYLDSTTISATANYGYVFSHWNDGNTDNPRTVQVTNNTTYTAYFDYDQFTITVQSDNTAQGNVSGGGNYNYLSNRTITATPTYGHHFTYWNDGVTENPRTITLTQDTTFTAHFAPNQYTLTVNAGEHGTATGGGTYNFGDTITIQAFPEEHYHFTRWNDGNTENPRQYRIEDNITLTAFFVIDTYTVSVVSSDIIRGMVEASGTEFVYGTPCTVTATAYTGYTFAGWSNGITANPYTFAVISDVELTALFVEEGEEVYTVTVESADPTMGSVSGGGQALSGGTLTIRAIPNDGYRFRCWNDGNTENPRTVTVTGNITYTAYFESTQGIGDIDATEIKIYTTGGRIVVQGAEGMEKRVYDLMGREVVRFNQNGETPVLPSGVYLVKAGTLPARKVVVLR